jgi:hypothetical protein
MKSLSDAIAGVENATTQLSNADTAQAAAQQKYDSAKAAKDDADKADADAVATFNDSLDALIQAATAAKVDRSAIQQPVSQ